MKELNRSRNNTEPLGGPYADEAGEVSNSAPPSSPPSPPQLALRRFRAEAEIHAISRALEQTGWNRRRAAELLSISYRGLLYKIRQYDITSATVSQLTGLMGGAKVE